jgi:hypothetical protein
MGVGTFLRRQHPRTIETSSGIGMTKHAAAHPSYDEPTWLRAPAATMPQPSGSFIR